MRRRQVLALPLALAPWPARAASDAPEDLVLARPGTLPIVLTAPHGGEAAIPGLGRRVMQDASERWRDTRDTGTWEIALGIAEAITRLAGQAPYLVLARFHRRFVDANRPPRIAYDDARAKPYYDRYHGSIRRFVDEVRGRFPHGLLLDIHGNVKLPDALARGTINGKSVARLVARGGFEAVTGPRGLFGRLEANGFTVYPANALPPEGRHEDGGFNGGFTTDTYGSHRPRGIDAVQLEFGTAYRKIASRASTAEKAARAIVAFHDAYLKQGAPGT